MHPRMKFFLTSICILLVSPATANVEVNPIVIGVDGGTESIRACCFSATTGHVVGKPCAVPYPTHHPFPGWAEQNPDDWYRNLGEAVRGAVASMAASTVPAVDPHIVAICVDTTCCSVVALDGNGQPLRPSLLWMDARSAPQTREILDKCKGDPALDVNCAGEGPLSAEWMTPKALWIKQNEPEIWEQAHTICEYQDYINWKLTGVMCASSCNAAARWHWNGDECCTSSEQGHSVPYPGRPLSMYKTLGMMDLADKLPKRCLPMGALVGSLTQEAARHLGLPPGLPVAQGGPDAFVGMIGLGCVKNGQLCLITGSSHLHCVVTATAKRAPGTWGAYQGAPVPGLNFAEGGQSSTGSIIRWAKRLFGETDYAQLDREAALINPGSDGLVALETFQGSRTPVTDPLARGALVGLTLKHTRAHIWRALMEAVCFGTRACVQGLAQAGHEADEIIIAGGAVRSNLWLQMHADVTGKPIVVCENIDAPLLGCAILASVAVGIFPDVDKAVQCMVRTERRIEPNQESHFIYSKLYNGVYNKLSSALKPFSHALFDIRGGQTENKLDYSISPSLLACDWSDMKTEITRCLAAKVPRLHVDVFDGVFLDSPYALTFGPKMVQAIRSVSEKAMIDIHLCVDRPERFIEALAKAGADRLIFQWEAMGGEEQSKLEQALVFSQEIKKNGMMCGISLNPETNTDEIIPLLESGAVDVIDILAVEPGFGGQVFQSAILDKVKSLRQWIDNKGDGRIQIMVDGGINKKTAQECLDAGTDVLVAGSFLFNHPVSLHQGVQDLLSHTSQID